MKRFAKSTMFILIVILLVVSLAACGGKKAAVTADAFRKAAEDNGLTVTDASDVYTDEIFTGSQIATSSDGWQVVFLTVDTAEHAKDYFGVCKKFMEGQKTGAGTAQTTERDTYGSYAQTNGGRYMYASFIEGTLVYVDADESAKRAVEEFVMKIGY